MRVAHFCKDILRSFFGRFSDRFAEVSLVDYRNRGTVLDLEDVIRTDEAEMHTE